MAVPRQSPGWTEENHGISESRYRRPGRESNWELPESLPLQQSASWHSEQIWNNIRDMDIRM